MRWLRSQWPNGLVLWYGVAVYLGLKYLEYIFRDSEWQETFTVLQTLVALFLGYVFVRLGADAIRALQVLQPVPETLPPAATSVSAGEPFPSTVTKAVGAFILATAAACTVGLFLALEPPSWLRELSGFTKPATKEAFVTLFGAGVGSSVSTILAFLKHASTYKDFDRAYTPWYIGRIVMGMLLGLIFYFLIKGGLLSLIPQGAGKEIDNLNDWALAGFGALVGLFSTNALDKLRELFNTLFRSEEEMRREILAGIPEDLREKVKPYILLTPASSPTPAPAAGGGTPPPAAGNETTHSRSEGNGST